MKNQLLTLNLCCFHEFWTILESKIPKNCHFSHFLFNISQINSLNQTFLIDISTQQIE